MSFRIGSTRVRFYWTFETMTADPLVLLDWLLSLEITNSAMESMGKYWKPVYNILEENFEVLLANAQHIKKVPRRKMDAMDADLLRHGLRIYDQVSAIQHLSK